MTNKTNASTKKSAWKKVAWAVITLLLAVLTIAAVLSQNKNLSFTQLAEWISQANPGYLILSFFLMLGYIFFEGWALKVVTGHMGIKIKMRQGFLYGAADVYFSAITPSASGGQPASAFFMKKNGIPMAKVTAALVINLFFCTAAMLLISVAAIPWAPGMFAKFSTLSKVLILVGACLLFLLTLGYYLLLLKQQILFRFASFLFRLLEKLHLMHHADRWMGKLERAEQQYKDVVRMFQGNAKVLVKVLLLNVAQRLSQLLVPCAVYKATGGSFANAGKLFVVQCYSMLGSSTFPIPGGMGAADYLMLDGYTELFQRDYAFMLELVGRSISFYSCIIISALATLIGYLLLRRKYRQ